MKIKLLFALLFVFGGVYSQNKRIIKLSRNATVKIIVYGDSITPQSYGTGFFLNNDSTIITCFHVVGTYNAQRVDANHIYISWDYYKNIKCVTSNNDTISVHVIPADFNDSNGDFISHDYAIIRPDKKTIKSVKWLRLSKRDKIKVGDNIYFSGYPLSLPLLSCNGFISGESYDNIFIQSPINNGNSGGALLDSRGRVIGIIDFKSLQLSINLEGFIDKLSKTKGGVFMRVDNLELAGNNFDIALLQTLRDNLNTGIGGAKNISYFRNNLH